MARPAPDVSIVIINKDEPALADTLVGVERERQGFDLEVVVVDASEGRLDHLRQLSPGVKWVPYVPTSNKRITIPEQRNVGVGASRGAVVVFIDAGCTPERGWLAKLIGPIQRGDETVTAGRTLGAGSGNVYDPLPPEPQDLHEAPTINLAFDRAAFTAVGGFDESFDYGSDIDFTWRLRHLGHRIRLVPDAVITHDWGASGRQLKRAWRYGQARARIYRKHPHEIPGGLRRDPVLFVYPTYLLLLPLALRRRWRWLPLLVLIPAWRARGHRPLMTVADHLAYGAGALSALRDEVERHGDTSMATSSRKGVPLS